MQRVWPVTFALYLSAALVACSGTPDSPSDVGAEAAGQPSSAQPATITVKEAAGMGTALERTDEGVQGYVDVGGYRLYLECRGSGEPAVILESAFSTGAAAWIGVQSEVAKMTRVCAYDRANRRRSDRGPEVNTAEQMVKDLRKALSTAGITGPYVLVGHSFGGYPVLYFAGRYPREVAGLVLVDVAHYNSYEHMVESPVMDRVDFIASREQVRSVRPLPNVPLVVLTRGLPHPPQQVSEEQWQEWQRDLATITPQGRQIVVPDAGHDIPAQRPVVVIEAIREVLSAVRGR